MLSNYKLKKTTHYIYKLNNQIENINLNNETGIFTYTN